MSIGVVAEVWHVLARHAQAHVVLAVVLHDWQRYDCVFCDMKSIEQAGKSSRT